MAVATFRDNIPVILRLTQVREADTLGLKGRIFDWAVKYPA
jgi:hypothetical protein